MPLAAAILIAFYIVTLALVLKWPRRQRHPEDGQAIGCLMLVICALVLLGGILALGWVLDIRWLTTAIFWITLFPVVLAAPQLLWSAIANRQKKALQRGTLIPPEELAALLSDRTHEFRRYSPEPGGEKVEARYFSPDGRLLCFERIGDAPFRSLETVLTWQVNNGRLRTVGDIRPGNVNEYTLYRAPDGQIGYYIHAPYSRLNRQLSRLTVAHYSGSPVAKPTASDSPPAPETPAH